MKEKLKNVISILILLLGIIIFSLAKYIVKFDASIDQLILSLAAAKGTSPEVIFQGFKFCLPIMIYLSVILFIPFFCKNESLYWNIRIKNKKFKKRFGSLIFSRFIYAFLIFLFLVCYSLNAIGVPKYIQRHFKSTSFIENYYIEPKEIDYLFPLEKQNLIYIFLESMETSFDEMKYDGKYISAIPNLKGIAEDNQFFSNKTDFGGFYSISGATWTVGSMVSQTSGIPLKIISDDVNSYKGYSNYLPGATSIGDILAEEGYNQVLLLGSDADFGGREDYFTMHGNYEIYDYKWAKDKEKISKNYYEWWGYEDSKLFEFAKDVLIDLSLKEEPFNLTMLTADTHFQDGYIDKSCDFNETYQYANSILCSDKLVFEFISWLEEQTFFENTTVIIVGDHLSMQVDISEYLPERTIYNSIINSRVELKNNKKRTFTAFDMFPTTLASLGVVIPGNRLGLGTNLYSGDPTLAEVIGIEEFSEELSNKSDFYNKYFLQDTYTEMLNELETESTESNLQSQKE